jgi:hypothetical protein
MIKREYQYSAIKLIYNILFFSAYNNLEHLNF